MVLDKKEDTTEEGRRGSKKTERNKTEEGSTKLVKIRVNGEQAWMHLCLNPDFDEMHPVTKCKKTPEAIRKKLIDE